MDANQLIKYLESLGLRVNTTTKARGHLGFFMKNRIDKEIVVNDDVLIGANSIILKGVHIGARSVVGAGSVVTKDVPSDCIVAGNPAKVIKGLKEGL